MYVLAGDINQAKFCDRYCFEVLEAVRIHIDSCELLKNLVYQSHWKEYAIYPAIEKKKNFIKCMSKHIKLNLHCYSMLINHQLTLKKLLVFLSENNPLTVILFLHLYSPSSNCRHLLKSFLTL